MFHPELAATTNVATLAHYGRATRVRWGIDLVDHRPAPRTVTAVSVGEPLAVGRVPAPFPVTLPGLSTLTEDTADAAGIGGAQRARLRGTSAGHFVLDDTTCWLRLSDTHPDLHAVAADAASGARSATTPVRVETDGESRLVSRDEMLALQQVFGSQILDPRIVEATIDPLAESFSAQVLAAVREASAQHAACRCGRTHLHAWLARAELTAHAHIKNAGSTYLLHVHPLTTHSQTQHPGPPRTDGAPSAWDASMASSGGYVAGHIASQPPPSLLAPLEAIAVELQPHRVSWAFYLAGQWVYQHIDIENRPDHVELLRSEYPNIEEAAFNLVRGLDDDLAVELLTLRRHRLTFAGALASAEAAPAEAAPVALMPLRELLAVCEELFGDLAPSLRRRIVHLAPHLPGYDLSVVAQALQATTT